MVSSKEHSGRDASDDDSATTLDMPERMSLPTIGQRDVNALFLLATWNSLEVLQRASNPPPNAHSAVHGGQKSGPPQQQGTDVGVFVPAWLVLTPARGCKLEYV